MPADIPEVRPNFLAEEKSPTQLENALSRFVEWLENTGYTSQDQYDFWASKYGVWAKELYYRRGKSAALLVLPLVAADWLLPSSRRLFCPKRRFPIADAHYLMGFMALYRASGNALYLTRAEDIAANLLESSLPGFGGHCWGYPFDWQTKRGLWKQGTPFLTTTPYVFDAFLDLHSVTGKSEYYETARSIAEFVANDIRHMSAGKGWAASYTPFDNSRVLNASAYRAACLATAAQVFGVERYRKLALENAHFILEQQQPDGAWLYSANDPNDTFIDHIHTCFVLKGLYRAYRILRDSELLTSVQRGYHFYQQSLFYADGKPRPFARADNTQFRVLELYDYAEALNLALLLQPDIGTGGRADKLVSDLLTNWQTASGYFVTRVSTGGIRNRVPYHRWGQSQVFRALANYSLQA